MECNIMSPNSIRFNVIQYYTIQQNCVLYKIENKMRHKKQKVRTKRLLDLWHFWDHFAVLRPTKPWSPPKPLSSWCMICQIHSQKLNLQRSEFWKITKTVHQTCSPLKVLSYWQLYTNMYVHSVIPPFVKGGVGNLRMYWKEGWRISSRKGKDHWKGKNN